MKIENKKKIIIKEVVYCLNKDYNRIVRKKKLEL